MNAETLATLVSQGLSQREIGLQLGRPRTTVSFWIRKHGLGDLRPKRIPAARRPPAPERGIRKAILAPLVAQGLTQREIGLRIGKAQTTVSFWVQEHGLTAVRPLRSAPKPKARSAGARAPHKGASRPEPPEGFSASSLRRLIAQGLSQRAIATKLGKSQTTVRHWMGVHALTPLPREAPTRTCAECQRTYTLGRNQRGRFCSLTCAGANRTNDAYRRWLAGDPAAIVGPVQLRRAVERRDGIECAECQSGAWRGRKVPVELEHKDGDSANNAPDNLCLLCPNCHAQTPTYKAKNRGNGRHARRQRYAAGASY